MNWTALGAIGELLGAIGVIASLLYLARQMRNSAADGRRAAAQAVLSKVNVMLTSISTHPQLADVFSRGSTSLSALRPEEALQYSGMLFSFARSYEELLHYRRAGAVEDWVWESVGLAVLPQMTTPGGLEWWAKRRHYFTVRFQTYVDSVLPDEMVEMLAGFEQSIEGKDFRSGVLIETESDASPLEEVG